MGLTMMSDRTISSPATIANRKANIDLRNDIYKAKVGRKRGGRYLGSGIALQTTHFSKFELFIVKLCKE